MAQSFHLFQRELTVTSSPIDVRLWIEELDYSFLPYGENFERAKINGEKLLNITRQKLKELNVVQTDHQDIILRAVANINRKIKGEEQAMQEEDQNVKKMPTRFSAQSEDLEHAIDRIIVMISERRSARALHGTNEQPTHNIFTAALELINVVKMILNILERPPLDCMSEFSSLKNHLIKHITLLNHFSEQSDINIEMESEMVHVCKNMSKMCHYVMTMPPELTGPEEMPPSVQVPIITEPDTMTFSVEHGSDNVPPIQQLSVPTAITSASSEHVFPIQEMSLQNRIVSYRSECFSPERLNTPSNEGGAVVMPHDEGNKSEMEVTDTKVSETLARSFDYGILQELLIIESGFPPPESGSEKCVVDSDSDRGIGLDYDSEKHWKDSDSVIWGTDSESEIYPLVPRSVRLLDAEQYQVTSSSVKELTESKEHLVEAEQFQMDIDSPKYWTSSDSEKCLGESDSEHDLMCSDNERPEIDSDSEKCPLASAPVKHLLKAEKCQMASDSIKRLLESEQRVMEIKQQWMISPTEKYVIDSDMEKHKMASASASRLNLIEKEKHQEKTRSMLYTMDSDSETCKLNSDSERHALATAAAECLMGTKTYQLSTNNEEREMDFSSEKHTIDLDSENVKIVSGTVKPMIKAKTCPGQFALERFSIDLKSESEKSCSDSEKQQWDFDYDRCLDSSRSYQHSFARFQDSSERYLVDFQTHWENLERHQIDFDPKNLQANLENEDYQKELECKRHMMEMEQEQCLIQFENERLQMDVEKKKYDMDSVSEKECRTVSDNERHHLDSENDAQRLGARKKGNRPHDFWRPIYMSSPCDQAKKSEEKYSVQKTDNKAVSTIQSVRHLSDKKMMTFKEVSPPPNDSQDSQQKLKEKYSHRLSPDPNTSVDDKHQRKASHKVSLYKSLCKEFRYQQSFESSGSQINLNQLIAKDSTSEVSVPDCHLTSTSSSSAVYPETQKSALDSRATTCSKCFVEISNPQFHKCLTDSDSDSEQDCTSHLQISMGSKYSLGSKSIRHHKTSRNRPLSLSLDLKQPVGIWCPLHQTDSKYSLNSTSYLQCESCSALQNLIGCTVTPGYPMNPQNTISYHSIHDPSNIINDVVDHEIESQFNLTTQLENETNPDKETKLVSADNLKNEANVKDKPLLKDEKDNENESDSQEETESEDEEDSEDENNTKDKKDPKDKSDPDNTDPKDSNEENDTDSNGGSDFSGGTEPTSGPDSNSDGDSNEGSDPNSEPESNIDKSTNNDDNSEYSTDSEDNYTNNADNASGLDNAVAQDCITGFNNGTNPNHTSELQNVTGMDYTSSFNIGARLSSAIKSGNDVCHNSGTGITNEAVYNTPDLSLNGSGLQNNSLSPQNNIQGLNIPGFNNKDSSLNINSLGHNNSLVLSNNSPSPDNISVLKKGPDSTNNGRPSHDTSSNNAFRSNKDADSNYDTKPTNAAGHNYSTVANNHSNLDYIPRFIHGVGFSFVVIPNYIAKNRYAARLNSTTSIVNSIDTSNTTSCVGASYFAYTSSASDTNYETRFSHVIDSNLVINPNYDAINTLNGHNSTGTSNINDCCGPKLDIGSSFSIPNIVYGSTLTFVAGTNHISTPENLINLTFYDSVKFGRNYTIIDDYTFGGCSKGNDGSVDSFIFMNTTKSKDVFVAKESDLLKNFSKVRNPISIKHLASLNFHSNSNILLLNFDIIVEADQPDVGKFAITSGSVNQLFKETTKRSGMTAWEAAEGFVQEFPKRIARRPKGGEYALRPTRRLAVNPGRNRSLSSGREHAAIHARRRSMSPVRGRARSAARGYSERSAMQHDLIPLRSFGPATEFTVQPTEINAGSISGTSGNQSTRSTSNSNESRRRNPILKSLRNFFVTARLPSWLDFSWLTRPFTSSLSEEDQVIWARAKFCALTYSDLGHGTCEGWLWKKRESTAFFFYRWKKYWFVLKHSTLYWFSNVNDIKADGFIYLPEFRIELAPRCGRNNAFVAVHAIIKDFYFAAKDVDEMNHWFITMLKIAIGSSFKNDTLIRAYRSAATEMFRSYTPILKKDFPMIQCSICKETSMIVSVNPAFQRCYVVDVSAHFVYFHPSMAETLEDARRQNELKLIIASYQNVQKEPGRPRISGHVCLGSLDNAEFPMKYNFEDDRSSQPFRGRHSLQSPWEVLPAAPLNREELHVHRTIPAEEREVGNRHLPLQENQARISLKRGQLQRPMLQRQRSHSLPSQSDIGSPEFNAPVSAVNPDETHFFPSHHPLFMRENANVQDSIEEDWQNAIFAASGGHPLVHSSFEEPSAMRRNRPGHRSRRPRVNVKVPRHNAVPVDDSGIPMQTFAVSVGNLGVPRNFRIPMGNIECLRNNDGTSEHVLSSGFTELSKISEHQV